MAAFAVAGTSVNGAAVTVTIPSGSNLGAVMTWFYEDGGGAGAPSVPGGATATSIGTPAYYRSGAAYRITGLSAGSATFTPPSSGGSQACIVVVFSGMDTTGDTDTGSTFAPFGFTTPELTLDTGGTDDMVVMFVANPTTAVTLAGAGGSTVRGESAGAAYGGTIGAVTRARSGATTLIQGTTAGTTVFAFGVQIVAAGGGGGPTQPPRSLHQFRQRAA